MRVSLSPTLGPDGIMGPWSETTTKKQRRKKKEKPHREGTRTRRVAMGRGEGAFLTSLSLAGAPGLPRSPLARGIPADVPDFRFIGLEKKTQLACIIETHRR